MSSITTELFRPSYMIDLLKEVEGDGFNNIEDFVSKIKANNSDIYIPVVGVGASAFPAFCHKYKDFFDISFDKKKTDLGYCGQLFNVEVYFDHDIIDSTPFVFWVPTDQYLSVNEIMNNLKSVHDRADPLKEAAKVLFHHLKDAGIINQYYKYHHSVLPALRQAILKYEELK